MISVTLYNKSELGAYLRREYKPGKSSHDIIADSEREISEYFSSEDKDAWMVIEYRGALEKIKEHLSLFTVKYINKYFLHVIIPPTATIELPEKVMAEVNKFNMSFTDDFIINMKYDDTYSSEEVGFRLICPRYTYADML